VAVSGEDLQHIAYHARSPRERWISEEIGATGFEPVYAGTKTRSLTTWRRPNAMTLLRIARGPVNRVPYQLIVERDPSPKPAAFFPAAPFQFRSRRPREAQGRPFLVHSRDADRRHGLP